MKRIPTYTRGHWFYFICSPCLCVRLGRHRFERCRITELNSENIISLRTTHSTRVTFIFKDLKKKIFSSNFFSFVSSFVRSFIHSLIHFVWLYFSFGNSSPSFFYIHSFMWKWYFRLMKRLYNCVSHFFLWWNNTSHQKQVDLKVSFRFIK